MVLVLPCRRWAEDGVDLACRRVLVDVAVIGTHIKVAYLDLIGIVAWFTSAPLTIAGVLCLDHCTSPSWLIASMSVCSKRTTRS